MKILMKPCVHAAALVVLLMSCQLWAAPLKAGDPAPDFELTTLSGQRVVLNEHKHNKPVYLKFWATWCSYCKAEMPHLQRIYDEYGEDIDIIAVNVGMNDSVANITQFYQQQGYNLPTFFDQQGELTSRYGVVGTPHHVLIDREGKIAYRTFLATDQLDETLVAWSKGAGTQDTHTATRTGK